MDFRILKLSLDLRQRKAFILIGALIITAIFIKSAIHYWFVPEQYEFSIEEKNKLYSLNAENITRNNQYFDRNNYRTNFKNYKKEQEERGKEKRNWFVFDPNSAPEEELMKLPLPEYVVNNIIKYRATGAKFKNPEHFSKVYGIEPYFEELKPYLNIKPLTLLNEIKEPEKQFSYQNNENENLQVADTTQLNTNFITIPKKDKNIIVEINNATEYELMLIPGIGQWYSKKMIETRDKLGGFLSKDQIYELSGIPSEKLDLFMSNIRIDASAIKKWKINKALNHEIYRHPYLTNKQAKILILYRDHHNGIKNADDFRNIKIFSEEEVQKLLPYLDFSK